MKLTAQEEYGLRCLIRVGREGPDASMTIAELSRREGISEPNVAKMMRLLRRGGFLRSTRGASGGYALARPAGDIVIGEVLAALGGRLFEANFCERHAGVQPLCAHMGDCSIRPVWRMVQDAVDQVLNRMTLADLLCNEQQMRGWPSSRSMSLPTYT
jgi:Rrf2 family protein